MIKVEELAGRRVRLWLEGTNNQTTLSFDVSAWQKEFPGASFTLAVQKPNGTIYNADVELNGSVLTWFVHYADVDVVGNGKAGIHAINQSTGLYAKSAEFSTIVEKSFTGHGGEYPEATEPWTARVEAAAATAVSAKNEAIVAKNTAHSAAINAAEYAEDARQYALDAQQDYAAEKARAEAAEAMKLDKYQGTENVGKAMVVGADGYVVPGEGGQGGGTVDTVNGVGADENKNVEIDASDILIDKTAENPATIAEHLDEIADDIDGLEEDIEELRSLTKLSVVGEDAIITITAHGMEVSGEDATLV